MDSKIIKSDIYNFILNNIRLLNQNIKEEILKFFIDKVINEIVIKTNRNKFPEDLKYLVIDIVNDLCAEYTSEIEPDANNVIQSMSEDGRSVNFGASDFFKTKMQLLLQQKLNDNEILIRKYRLLYKVVCPYEKQN